MKQVDTLNLSLKRSPFEVMVAGEKVKEYRKPSDWIKSRLLNKDGAKRNYTYVLFVNGYGAIRPRFRGLYLGFTLAEKNETITYSNGLTVDVEIGDFVIDFGII